MLRDAASEHHFRGGLGSGSGGSALARLVGGGWSWLVGL